jgi:hypothetical protein
VIAQVERGFTRDDLPPGQNTKTFHADNLELTGGLSFVLGGGGPEPEPRTRPEPRPEPEPQPEPEPKPEPEPEPEPRPEPEPPCPPAEKPGPLDERGCPIPITG